MSQPVERQVGTDMDAIDSSVLGTFDTCCIIQLLSNILSFQYYSLHLSPYKSLSFLNLW